MKQFNRRLYQNPGDFLKDFRYILSNRELLKSSMREDMISTLFRERLMLVVTQVNGCRYCSYFHASEALKAGISEEELGTLLEGCIPEDSPQEEFAALLYAQHWAESNAKPDNESLKRLVAIYGKEKTDAIHIILRMIRVGNLLGNLGDYLLYRISFGKLGLSETEKQIHHAGV
jgi:AhpD family alkylhydroperoxidase